MPRIWDLSQLPYLQEQQYLNFQVNRNCGDVIAVGGNLSPGLLLSAYRQGLFPWYNAGEDICWWSPRRRFVLFLDTLHLPKSLVKRMKRSLVLDSSGLAELEGHQVRLTLNRAFANVIRACAHTPRNDQASAEAAQPHNQGSAPATETWITPEMQYAYIQLHARGYAHSVECWMRVPNSNEYSEYLAGGLYGVSLGPSFRPCFCGESMFALVPDTSKLAFACLALFLRDKGFRLIDCQQESDHLRRFGARLIAREEFEKFLQPSQPTLESLANERSRWQTYRKEFPASDSLRQISCK